MPGVVLARSSSRPLPSRRSSFTRGSEIRSLVNRDAASAPPCQTGLPKRGERIVMPRGEENCCQQAPRFRAPKRSTSSEQREKASPAGHPPAKILLDHPLLTRDENSQTQLARAKIPSTHRRATRTPCPRRTAPAPTPPLGTETAGTSRPGTGLRRRTSLRRLATRPPRLERAAGDSLRWTPPGSRRASPGRNRERLGGPTGAPETAPSPGGKTVQP